MCAARVKCTNDKADGICSECGRCVDQLSEWTNPTLEGDASVRAMWYADLLPNKEDLMLTPEDYERAGLSQTPWSYSEMVDRAFTAEEVLCFSFLPLKKRGSLLHESLEHPLFPARKEKTFGVGAGVGSCVFSCGLVLLPSLVLFVGFHLDLGLCCACSGKKIP